MGDTPDYERGQSKPVPNHLPSMHDLVREDLQERKEYGLNKYDSLLQPFNGRNFLQDIYEELQDAIVYTRGALEEQKLIGQLMKHTLEGYVFVYDKTFPDESDKVLIKAANLPGWVVEIYREVLGDRFEYTA